MNCKQYLEINEIALKEGAPCWSARAILTRTYLDILPDRQEAIGIYAGVLARLNGGALSAAREAAKGLNPVAWEPVCLYDQDGFEVWGNPNGSHGYLYMVAFFKEDRA